MKITFLGQGFESESKNSVGKSIIRLFKESKFNSFTGISAFASEAGVAGLTECIESCSNNYETFNLIVGIDQEGTSKKALLDINNLGINSYIFYQKESPIFHPKIYLFEGKNDTSLIVGSSNLTARGLFGNVESSLMVEFKNDCQDGIKLLEEIKHYYNTLFDFTDENLFKISPEVINQFVTKGIVPTKIVWKPKRKKKTSDIKSQQKNELEIPRRPTVKIPSSFKGRYKSNNTVSKLIEELKIENAFQLENPDDNKLVWRSGILTERTFNIPKGGTTNATGSMGLTKGALKDIDHRHYFRDVVFSGLNWEFDKASNKSHIERANVDIKIVILGVDYGNYRLKLTHNTRTDITSYKQKNSMTQLSWGEAKNLVAQEELIGKIASLYKNVEQGTFTLIIE